MTYLDNSATTSIDPEVLDAMLPYLREEYGNPSSKYYTLAANAHKAVEQARQQVADLLNAESAEIIFTSGATESNNFVLKGVADHYENRGKHLITTPVEHKSIMETCKYLSAKGYEVTYIPVSAYGQAEYEVLSSILRKDTILVSIMWGNNEVGSTNDIAALSSICQKNDILFHTDATQVLGKIPVDLKKSLVNFLSCSAHKLHGPKGIGACFVRKTKLGLKTKLTPLLHGGSQENGYRAGTLAVHNIVGFGKACEIARQDMKTDINLLLALEAKLSIQLQEKIPILEFNHHPKHKIPGVMSLTIPGINNELLVKALASAGFALSTGSACSAAEPSHVLAAIGASLEKSRSTIRISLDRQNDEQQIVQFSAQLEKIYQTLKS